MSRASFGRIEKKAALAAFERALDAGGPHGRDARKLLAVSTLQVTEEVARLSRAADTRTTLLAAAGTLTMIPGAIVIFFVRNYIAKGFALGRV